MMERVPTGMLTTTNSLESTHGHLNERTPRRSAFWGSLHRIAQMMLMRSAELDSAIRHNFNEKVRSSFKRSIEMDPETMVRERNFYHTTRISCACGETLHLSRIYRIPVPSSHQNALGVQKSYVPDVFDPSCAPIWPRCVTDVTTVDREAPDGSPRRVSYLKNLALKNIKRFRARERRER
jgi:hypothetical protein